MTVVGSASSVTVVLTELPAVMASKLPPLVVVMPTLSVSVPCASASSARTANGAELALLAPTGMVMVWPLLSVSTTGEPVTTLLSVAV